MNTHMASDESLIKIFNAVSGSALSAAGAEEPPPQAVMVASSAAQTAPAESLRSRE